MTHSVSNELDAIAKTSRNLGVTAEQLQKMQFAADLAGIDAAKLTVSLKTLAKTANEAGQGVATYADTYDRLGVNVRDVTGNLKTVDVLMLDVADAFTQMDDATEKAAIATELFGRSGLTMVGFLNQGADGIQKFMDSAEDLGLVLSTETAQAAEAFNDRMSVMAQVIRNRAIRAMLDFTPAIEAAMRWITNFSAQLAVFTEDVIKPLGRAFIRLGEIFGTTSLAIVAALTAVRVAMLANPFIAIATAAILAVTFIIDHWEQLKAWFEFKLPSLMWFIEAKWQGVVQAVHAALVPLVVKVATVFDAVANVIIKGMDMLRQKLLAFAEGIGEAMGRLGQDTTGVFEVMTRLTVPLNEIDTASKAAAAGAETLSTIQAKQADAMMRSEAYANLYRIALENLKDPAAAAAAATEALTRSTEALAGTGSGSGGGGGGKKGPIAAATDQLITMSKALETVNESMIKTAVDGFMSFADALLDGTANFKDFARDMLKDIAKLIIRFIILNALMQAVGFKSNGVDLTSAGKVLSQMGAIGTKFAKGGVVNSPTTFAHSGGIGQAGEAGPEAIIPLRRDSAGNLGVSAVTPNIIVNNYSGQEVSVDANEQTITIAVGRSVAAVESNFTRSMATGQGAFARGIEMGYGSRRKAT